MRVSLWFVPLIMSFLALLFALFMHWLDVQVPNESLHYSRMILSGDTESLRGALISITTTILATWQLLGWYSHCLPYRYQLLHLNSVHDCCVYFFAIAPPSSYWGCLCSRLFTVLLLPYQSHQMVEGLKALSSLPQ